MKRKVIAFLTNQVVERAANTFVQAFIAVFFLSGMTIDQTALTAGVAAGLSALKNYVKGLRQQDVDQLVEDVEQA